ncbi:uncharacterized protein LOC128161577 [Crassostrea angulata]|uniref:uncharacterized protein LOC128161577 n=1 Tax=Magallana angulata TaxID=2784310 RepID=UPI0022B1364D|nr:uncharacterized protein LOC128161577 [Crassostrea angulata]
MLLLVFILVVKGNEAYNMFEVFFESHSCDTPPHHLNPLNSEVIVASYEGGPIRCDYVAFSTFNDPDLVTYELMVNPLYHEDPDCAISLLYRSTLTSKELKRFNCSALAEDRYNLKMTKNSTFYLQIIPTNSNLEKARFKLKLIPTGATFSTEDLIAIISGGSIGLVVLLSLVGFGICLFRKKRKDKK